MTYLVGRQIGRYQIQEEIGRGGMARVYRALDTSLQRPVALKVLAPQLAVDPEFAQRFQREAITAANLRHPNIVLIFDVGEEDGLRYIAMEFVEGRTLHAIIQERGALGLGPAVSVIDGVGAALDHAHQQGAIHRDIKPHNVMVDTSGRVLLTDFGIAQPPDRGDGADRLTRTGVFMGTPEYISPEQASAQRLDGRSDLYSLGITAYEIITGRVPFSGATPQLIVAHVQEPPPPPTSVDGDLPWELDAVMARILAKRPENRYRTAEAFADALRAVARKRNIVPASRAQLAQLAKPRSTAGEGTLTLNRDPTKRAEPVVPIVVVPPVAIPATEAAGQIAPPPRQRPVASPAPTRPSQPSRASQTAPRAVQRPTSQPASRQIGWWNTNMFIGLAVAIVVVLLAAYAVRSSSGGVNPFVPSPTGVPPATIRPTNTASPTPSPTDTPVPTNTPAPTETPQLAPTNTLRPLATVPPPPPPTPVPPPPATSEPEQPTAEAIPTAETTVPADATVEPPTSAPEPPTNTPEPQPEPPTTEPALPTAVP